MKSTSAARKIKTSAAPNARTKILSTKTITLIVPLVLLGIFFMHFFYFGPSQTFDDAKYVQFGAQFLNQTFHAQNSTYSYGIGFIASIASGELLGSPVIPQILEYITLAILTYFLCLHYFNRTISFLCAASLELSGFVLIYATRVLPDMLLGVLLCLSLLVLAYREDRTGIFVAGLLGGSIIFVKFGAFLIVLPIILAFFLFKDRNKLLTLIAGILLSVLIYAIIMQVFYNATLPYLVQSYSSLQSSLSTVNLNDNVATFVVILGDYLPNPVFSQLFPLGGLFIFALVGFYRAYKNKVKAMLFYGITLIVSVAYLFFGTESLTHYVFIVVVSRYFILLAPIMAVLLGYYLQLKWDAHASKKNSTSSTLAVLKIFGVVIALNLPIYLYFLYFLK